MRAATLFENREAEEEKGFIGIRLLFPPRTVNFTGPFEVF
jgi:hypothetical protein